MVEITHLKLNDMYRALAMHCNESEDRQGEACFAENSNLGCPFGMDENGDYLSCVDIEPDHWREVFEGKDEPEPEFQFGDKVTVEGMQAVFVRYKDTKREYAYIVFEGSSYLFAVRRVATLDAGWE